MSEFIIQKAEQQHLSEIVRLLADDILGKSREDWVDPLPECYQHAFTAIQRDLNQELLVMLKGEEVIGTLQLTFIPQLVLQGGMRAQVEGVRIKTAYQGRGLGHRFFEYVIDRAKQKGCVVVQLTTNSVRKDAIRFYESLGFKPSHIGMKLQLMDEME